MIDKSFLSIVVNDFKESNNQWNYLTTLNFKKIDELILVIQYEVIIINL